MYSEKLLSDTIISKQVRKYESEEEGDLPAYLH